MSLQIWESNIFKSQKRIFVQNDENQHFLIFLKKTIDILGKLKYNYVVN